MDFLLRQARLDEREALQQLIIASARGLSQEDYTPEQIEAALEGVFGVDTALIEDGTYLVAVHGDTLIGCGGWSKRKTLFGGDKYAGRQADLLTPGQDAAKIRAFFVHPAWARKGVGRALLERCEQEAEAAGFTSLEMMATLPGLKLYRTLGYIERDRVEYKIGTDASVPIQFVPMYKTIKAV